MRKILMAVVTAAVGVVSAEDAYLQSDGTQVIDTGYFVNAKTKIEVDFEFTGATGNSNAAVFGQNQTTGQKGNRLVLYRNGSKQLTVGYFNSSWQPATEVWTDIAGDPIPNRRTFVFDSTATKNHAKLFEGGRETKATTIDDGEFSETATLPMSIFGWTTTTGYGLPAKMKLYSFKVYEKDDESAEFALVHDYLPAIDETDGKAKLLDCAGGRKTFLTAVQGGDFAFGGDIPTLREDPYLESDGTQVIDTGYKVNAKTRIEVDFQLTEKTDSANKMIFGQYGNNELTLFVRPDGFRLGFDYNNGTAWVWGSDPLTAQNLYRHTFVYDVPTDTFSFDGQEKNNSSKTTRSTATATLSIFDRHRVEASNGSMWAANGRTKMKLYSFKIYEDGLLVRDFRPIIDVDGEGKLLDCVNNTFYADANAEGNPFKVNAPRVRSGEAYLEATGSQAIDSGYLINEETRIEVDFQLTGKPKTENMVVYGEQVGDNGNQLTFYSTEWTFRMGYGIRESNAWTSYEIGAANLSRHTCIYDVPTDNLLFDGARHAISEGSARNTATVTMGIFNRHRATPVDGSMWYNLFAKMKLYKLRIYEADELVHQYLPYKNGDVVGLYDTVTGEVKTDVMRGAPFEYGEGACYNYKGIVPETMAVMPKEKYGVSPTRAAKISVLAPGAFRYVWKKNGAVVEGADAATLEVALEDVHGHTTYSVQAMYLVDGAEVAGPTAETVVGCTGLVISVR